VVTTTPKPTLLLRELLKRPGVVVTKGSTYDNLANLAPTFIEQIVAVYEGTRLGRQELLAELLEDVEGALWTGALMEAARWHGTVPDLRRILVAIDPATTTNGNETGIVVAGLDGQALPHGYLLDDQSGHYSPDGWAGKALWAYHKWRADRIVAESNQGGEMVSYTIQSKDRNVPVTLVHAKRGKYIRAEPVVALYEQGRIHHAGLFPTLETQLTTWVPGEDSPDRLDALVWAFTQLLVGAMPSGSPATAAPRPARVGMRTG
jgi:phage terminase large subunit-like protein